MSASKNDDEDLNGAQPSPSHVLVQHNASRLRSLNPLLHPRDTTAPGSSLPQGLRLTGDHYSIPVVVTCPSQATHPSIIQWRTRLMIPRLDLWDKYLRPPQSLIPEILKFAPCRLSSRLHRPIYPASGLPYRLSAAAPTTTDIPVLVSHSHLFLRSIFGFRINTVTTCPILVYLAVCVGVIASDPVSHALKDGGELNLERAYRDLHRLAARQRPVLSRANDDVRAYVPNRLQNITQNIPYARVVGDIGPNATWPDDNAATSFKGMNIPIKIDGTDPQNVPYAHVLKDVGLHRLLQICLRKAIKPNRATIRSWPALPSCDHSQVPATNSPNDRYHDDPRYARSCRCTKFPEDAITGFQWDCDGYVVQGPEPPWGLSKLEFSVLTRILDTGFGEHFVVIKATRIREEIRRNKVGVDVCSGLHYCFDE
ncbi:hypothetical protein P691DRAFT_777490 [Macrolepiota fuliginosa MF-IS2]|uniref:Uncharacterized protein n=1 Tax=Macrolepiota fuliginosa MF-IS2 TaxID=1400762 RepID=A0A9P5X8E2_9AGAR|nr:hypothetical protein P691DRAFT_777490 [Macrolepiota fuliginosa MF-IS2]